MINKTDCESNGISVDIDCVLDFEPERLEQIYKSISRFKESTVQKSSSDIPVAAISLFASTEVGVHVCPGGAPIRSTRVRP